MKRWNLSGWLAGLVTAGLLLSALGLAGPAYAQGLDPAPPDEPVKLIFIHHSTGENWLDDEWGGLGLALAENNYFVSDTNYGWGPDGIGDRTDIVDWPTWFRGPESPRYMDAVFNESEQNSAYSRLFGDPGGENRIVMFKSCFPNSELSGSPEDPPTPGRDYTVGNAKYIYNDLLNYFMTRPDKLFVVITSPPVSDSTYGENARAFTSWLMEDWLEENNYPYNNVAVFDFYNILTEPDNHHRYNNGVIEYVNDQGGNTLHYPSGSGDDHPNPEGSQKATDEFIELLNIFYNRWRVDAPDAPPEGAAAPPPAEDNAGQPSAAPGSSPVSGVVDGFEGGGIPSYEGWMAYWDASTETRIACEPNGDQVHGGSASLLIDFDVEAESWATCVLEFGEIQDWSGVEGVSFYYRSSEAALILDVSVNAGSIDDPGMYQYLLETTPDSAADWVGVEIPWEYFTRVSWEANGGTPLSDTASVHSFGFGFAPYEGTSVSGMIWVDDIELVGGEEPAPAEETGAEEETGGEAVVPVEGSESQDGNEGGAGLCGGFALTLMIFGFSGLWMRRER